MLLIESQCFPSMAAPQRSIFINLTSLLVCRRLRGRCCNFPLKLGRSLCSTTSMDGHEEMNSADAAMMLGLKGKECRYRRSLKLRKNRHDTCLEKKARTGHCKMHRWHFLYITLALKRTQVYGTFCTSHSQVYSTFVHHALKCMF